MIPILVAAGAPAPPDTVVVQFQTEEDRRRAAATGAATTLVDGSKPGMKALRATFSQGEWPNIAIRPATPWNWSGAGALAVELRNPGDRPVEFGVRVDDDPSADGARHCRQGTGMLEPGQSAAFVLPLGGGPMEHGMRGLPRRAGGFRLLSPTAMGALEASHIVAFQVFVHAPPKPVTLDLISASLVDWSVPLEGIVDRFGQYTGATWPGKAASEQDLRAGRARDEADLARAPALPERDHYGGWLGGPQLKATGRFRTEKVGGKWWLVTPEGRLFLSLGIDCVRYDEGTMATGRERMFTWLPKEGDPLARHFQTVRGVHMGPVKEGRAFSFHAANLERKHGPAFHQAWLETALRRLPSWGFNTVGNWSDQRLYRNGRVPYVATAHVDGPHARLGSGSDYWGKMHDPFDPLFAQSVANSLGPVAEKVKGDPWCVGWFVDNELSWAGQGEEGGRYGLGLGALSLGADAPAKRALISQLRAKYGDAAALSAAWGRPVADWSALEAPFRPAGPLSPAMKQDMAAFVRELALRYFRTVKAELDRLDPGHLYLGCRFAWRSPDAVQACAEVADVVSFNFYVRSLQGEGFRFLNDLGKPCIIGEFHSGALDRGMFHTGLVAARDQADRAAMYREYVRSVVDHPALVGCHWFQWVDQPLTGRWFDGENYNIGFVNVADVPYPEMVAAAREVHGEAYARRFGRGISSGVRAK